MSIRRIPTARRAGSCDNFEHVPHIWVHFSFGAGVIATLRSKTLFAVLHVYRALSAPALTGVIARSVLCDEAIYDWYRPEWVIAMGRPEACKLGLLV
jgi:hypothetical protein